MAQAFGRLRETLRAVEGQAEWKYKMLARVGAIEALAVEFAHEVAHERLRLDDGEKLYKDYPPINKKRKIPIPKRQGGFIDDAHQIENQLTVQVREFVREAQDSALCAKVPLAEEDKQKVIASLRGVVEVMDDQGIYLNQLRGFAGKSTMPQDPDPKMEGTRMTFSPGVFTLLNMARGDEKKAKGRE